MIRDDDGKILEDSYFGHGKPRLTPKPQKWGHGVNRASNAFDRSTNVLSAMQEYPSEVFAVVVEHEREKLEEDHALAQAERIFDLFEVEREKYRCQKHRYECMCGLEAEVIRVADAKSVWQLAAQYGVQERYRNGVVSIVMRKFLNKWEKTLEGA